MSAQTAGPDIEGVLGDHRSLIQVGQAKACTCGWEDGFVPDATEAHRAHVAAALRAEVGRWLGSEGAVSVATEPISDAWLDDGHGLACEYRDRPHDVTSEASAHAALAALAAQVAPSRVPGEGS